MKTFKQYLIEHCKHGDFFKPYNMLQAEILEVLYQDYLKDNITGFESKNIHSLSDIIIAFNENLRIALEILGNEMCEEISNYKTIKHTKEDVKRWAHILFKILASKEKEEDEDEEERSDLFQAQRSIEPMRGNPGDGF